MRQLAPKLAVFAFLAPLALFAQDAFQPAEEETEDQDSVLKKFFEEGATQAMPKGPELDTSRGKIVFEAEEGTYEKGAHFGKWHWPSFTGDRWGMYRVQVTYVSVGAKMGFQFYVGDKKAKGYLPQSGNMQEEYTAEIGKIYIPDTQTHNVGVLTGDDSNGASFKLRKITLVPGPEGKEPAQSIDGTITLAAGEATTFSKKMRYEPKEAKNCLGFWTDENDWAQWELEVHEGGKFKMEVFQGCGGGNHGSEVAIWLNEEQHKFTVADTGGFQNWQAVELGEVELKAGKHLVTVKPLNKTNKAVWTSTKWC